MGAWAKVVTRITRGAIALGLASLLAACGGGGDGEAPEALEGMSVTSAPAPLRHIELPLSDWTGDDGQHVVRNTSDWEATWLAIQWREEAAPSLTGVNFKQQMLVGVTSSYGGCSGSITITSAERETTPTGEGWVVAYQVQDLGGAPGVACTADMKPVVDFILLPASPAAVRFVELPRLR